jgi:hypothetical protein
MLPRRLTCFLIIQTNNNRQYATMSDGVWKTKKSCVKRAILSWDTKYLVLKASLKGARGTYALMVTGNFVHVQAREKLRIRSQKKACHGVRKWAPQKIETVRDCQGSNPTCDHQTKEPVALLIEPVIIGSLQQARSKFVGSGISWLSLCSQWYLRGIRGVISLLNYLSKVVKKIAAKAIAQHYKAT